MEKQDAAHEKAHYKFADSYFLLSEVLCNEISLKY